jgi:hypothetical protein
VGPESGVASSSSELEISTGGRVGTGLPRGVVLVVAFDFGAGRGGLNAEALRCAVFAVRSGAMVHETRIDTQDLGFLELGVMGLILKTRAFVALAAGSVYREEIKSLRVGRGASAGSPTITTLPEILRRLGAARRTSIIQSQQP